MGDSAAWVVVFLDHAAGLDFRPGTRLAFDQGGDHPLTLGVPEGLRLHSTGDGVDGKSMTLAVEIPWPNTQMATSLSRGSWRPIVVWR